MESKEKIIREIFFKDGCSQKWYYDPNKDSNNPFMVEMFYPKGYFKDEIDEVENENLPKTKRKYLNPSTGKMVAYFRAKELGII